MNLHTSIPLTMLFDRCVKRTYIRTPDHVDYAYDRVDHHLILYFQDSDGALDWLRNLNFPAVAYRLENQSVLYVHRGFLNAWLSIMPRIEPLVTDEDVERITVVGYSHGAALAVLCHAYVWNVRPDLREDLIGYGFGAPRIIWGRIPPMIRECWKNFTVIRNRSDIVTHVPPRIFGYRHVGKLLEIGSAGKYSPIGAHRAENIHRELRIYERKGNASPNA